MLRSGRGLTCAVFAALAVAVGAYGDVTKHDGGLPSALPPLMKALQLGQERRATALIKKGADVNERDKYGRTNLEVAILQDRSMAIIRLLIESGANVNAIGEYQTPVGNAITTCRVDVLRLLLDSGADPSTPVGRRRPAAREFAEQYGCPAVKQVLATFKPKN